MTSQSITDARRSCQGWMYLENDFQRSTTPHAVRVAPDPSVRLMKIRRESMGRRLEALKASGRVPRVGLYALTVNGQSPGRSLQETRAFAVRAGWQVGPEQPFVDRFDATNLQTRTGWLLLKQQIRAGFADGVVVLTQSVITSNPGEYERELDWFSEHFGFIAMVHPESQARS